MAGDYSAKPEDDANYTKVGRKGKKVTFPFEEPSARIDQVQDDWEHGEDKPDDGSITPIEYIDRVIASHAPSHMKDKPTREKARHVEDEVSRLKQRIEDFKATTERTRQSTHRASLTHTTTISCKILCPPSPSSLALRSLLSLTQNTLIHRSLSLCSEHGPQ